MKFRKYFVLSLVILLACSILVGCKEKDKTCAEDPTQEKCEQQPAEKTCAEDPTQEKCKVVNPDATDQEKADADKNALSADLGTVSEDFTLPVSGTNGSTITWAVKSGTGVAVQGRAAKISQTSAVQTVVLTATIKNGAATATKDVTVKVAAKQGGGGTPVGEYCSTNPNQEKCLDPDTWDWEYNRVNFDGKAMDIKIMVLPKNEYDPTDADYKGERATEKKQLMATIEAEYNITLQYLDYPGEAPWGPSRVKWIYEGVNYSNDVGEVFLIDSSWIPTLVKNKALAILSETKKGKQVGIFTDYGYEQDPNFNTMSSVNGKVYGYSSGMARPDHWLHYNQTLIDQYGLPDPATLWNNNEWTWSAFQDLLAEAQTAFKAEEETKGQKWAMGGDYFEIALGFAASRGLQFVKGELVLLANAGIIGLYDDLQDLEDLYWEPNGSTVSTVNFNTGKVLFNSGSMWFYGNNDRWPATLEFEISAVPYPRMDNDESLSTYKIPLKYESVYGVKNVANGENGINSEIIFNIMDDLTRGLKPESKSTALSTEEKYQAYLEKRISSEQSIKAILSAQSTKYTYFEMIQQISMTLGDGSHYGEHGIYPRTQAIIVNTANDMTPAVELNALQSVYQNKLAELLAQ